MKRRYLVEWYDSKSHGEKIFKNKYDAEEYRYKMMDAARRAKVYTLIRCCGKTLLCTDFTNTCDVCGADYNFNGDLLAPREQWGEETNERWQDCY